LALLARCFAAPPGEWDRSSLRSNAIQCVLPLAVPFAVLATYSLLNRLELGSFFPSSMMAKSFLNGAALASHQVGAGVPEFIDYLAGIVPVFLGSREYWGITQHGYYSWLRTPFIYLLLTRSLWCLCWAGFLIGMAEGIRPASPGKLIRVAVYVFCLLQSLVYFVTYPFFASQSSYINWYYVPQLLLVIEGTATVFDASVARSKGRWRLRRVLAVCASAATIVAIAIVAAVGYTHARIVGSRSDVNQWVRAAKLLNAHTPPGTRAAGFSVGMQSFFLEDNRSLTNLDGVINSPGYVRTYLAAGHIQQFLKDGHIEYLSDDLGADAGREDISFSTSVVDRHYLFPMTQWYSWNYRLYSIARFDPEGKATPEDGLKLFPAAFHAHGPAIPWEGLREPSALVLSDRAFTEGALSLASVGRFDYLKLYCDVQPVERQPAAAAGALEMLVSANGFPGLIAMGLPGDTFVDRSVRRMYVFVRRTSEVSELRELFIRSSSHRFDFEVQSCGAVKMPWDDGT
jgi:hypothetical protein